MTRRATDRAQGPRSSFAARGARLAGTTLLLALAAFSLMGSTGCFFSPRDPKGTAGFDSTLTRWRTPSTPGILLSNVRVTYEDRQDAFYGRCVADSFRFIADAQDSIDFATQGRTPFAGWNGAVEKDVAFLIFSASDSIRLVFSDLSPPDSTTLADTVRVRKIYDMRIYSTDGGAQVVSTQYEGIATFFMNDLPAGWTLTRWEDTRGATLPSWGKLRGDNRTDVGLSPRGTFLMADR